MSELAVIATNEVPAATFVGTFKKSMSAGTIRKPPPIPSNPVNMPTNVAAITTKCHFGFSAVG